MSRDLVPLREIGVYPILVVNVPFDEDWEPGDILKYRLPRRTYDRSFGNRRLKVDLTTTALFDPERWRVLGIVPRLPGRPPRLAILRSIDPVKNLID